MVLSGLVSARSLIESLLHLPALVTGIWLGNLLHDAASEQLFAASSLAILAGAGAVFW